MLYRTGMLAMQSSGGLTAARYQSAGSNGIISSALRFILGAVSLMFNLQSVDLFIPVAAMLLDEAKSWIKNSWFFPKTSS